MPRFSLIIATLNRPSDLQKALESFCLQTYKDFEVIIVDQSIDDSTEKISLSFQSQLDLKYIRSSRKGLSHNRNLGIRNANGAILAFPDDDCEYDIDTLEIVNQIFDEKNLDIVSCNQKDRATGRKILKIEDIETSITKANVLRAVVSISIFIRIKQPTDVQFDESLGAGTYFGSGEETDLMLHLLDKAYQARFFPYPYVFHKTEDSISYDSTRAYKYGLGFGALFKKDIVYRKNYQFFFLFIKYLFRPFIGSIFTSNRSYYYNSLKGRIKGFWQYSLS